MADDLVPRKSHAPSMTRARVDGRRRGSRGRIKRTRCLVAMFVLCWTTLSDPGEACACSCRRGPMEDYYARITNVAEAVVIGYDSRRHVLVMNVMTAWKGDYLGVVEIPVEIAYVGAEGRVWESSCEVSEEWLPDEGTRVLFIGADIISYCSRLFVMGSREYESWKAFLSERTATPPGVAATRGGCAGCRIASRDADVRGAVVHGGVMVCLLAALHLRSARRSRRRPRTRG